MVNISPWSSDASPKHDIGKNSFSELKADKLNEAKAIPKEEATVVSTIINLVTSFTSYTSAHGFGHFHRTWSYGWQVAVFFLIVAVAFSLVALVMGFLMIREMTHPGYYESKVKAIQDTRLGLSLPRFTLSNAGFFNYSSLEELNVTSYEASLVSVVMIGKLAFTKLLLKNVKKANTDYHALLSRLNTTERDIWKKLSYQCEDIIIDCVFQHVYIPGPECCQKYFTTVLGHLGLSFLATKEIMQDRETVSAGLSMTVRVPTQPLSLDWDYMNHRATVLQGGLRFNILGNDKGYDSEVSSLVPVTGRERTMVTLSYTKHDNQHLILQHDNTGLYKSLTPWMDHNLACTPGDAPFEKRAKVGQNCHSFSVHNCTKKLRQCVLVNYPFWNGVDRICDIEDLVHLTLTAVNVSLECQRKYFNSCGPACEDSAFTYSTLNTPLLYLKEDTSNSSWYVEGAFTMFYAKLSYTLFTQTRPDIMIMLSAVGGQVGLFMGGSFITLAEFITVLSCIFMYSLTRIYKFFTHGR
ncbi:Epithelial sodium channel [Trinorchestia longiramus]|nr:Epithelial sodium channel [Trinorchestia longiramus]